MSPWPPELFRHSPCTSTPFPCRCERLDSLDESPAPARSIESRWGTVARRSTGCPVSPMSQNPWDLYSPLRAAVLPPALRRLAPWDQPADSANHFPAAWLLKLPLAPWRVTPTRETGIPA